MTQTNSFSHYERLSYSISNLWQKNDGGNGAVHVSLDLLTTKLYNPAGASILHFFVDRDLITRIIHSSTDTAPRVMLTPVHHSAPHVPFHAESKYPWDVPELREKRTKALLHLANPSKPRILLIVDHTVSGRTNVSRVYLWKQRMII